MKNAFRGILFLLAALMLFACAKKEEAPAAPAAGATAGPLGKQDPMAKYDPIITVTSARVISSGDRFDETDPDKQSYEVNRWNRTYKEKLGVDLKYSWLSPDGDSDMAKWAASIAARNIPDFARVNDSVYKQLYEADLLADLTDIWQAYVTDEYLESLAPNDVAMMHQDGKMYGFPGATRSMSGTSMLFIRKDWMDQLGIQPPETLDDVAAIARKFKEAQLAGPDTIPILFSNNVSGGANFQGVDGKWDGFLNGFGAYLNYWLEKDGKLAYSTIQPEVRPALLKLQAWYKEGLINRDFAALNVNLARELIAAGKAGIWYSAAWQVTQGMNTLILNNPQYRTEPWKMLHWQIPVPEKKGDVVKVQTNTPKGMRIYVSNQTANPEAPLKMAIMSYHLKRQSPEDYAYYTEGTWRWFSYLPWGDHFTPTHWDLYRAHAMRVAVQTGDLTLVKENGWDSTWESYQNTRKGMEGTNPSGIMYNGPEGDFTVLYDYYNQGNILMDQFFGLPTDTMTLKGDILRGGLETAMFEVVMGADISVWDAAVKKWAADGGDQIVAEMNAWYDTVKDL